jgi:hypothetical protein
MKIGIPPVNENPDDADVHLLDDRINEYNFETTGITDGRIVSFSSAMSAAISSLVYTVGPGVEPARCATCGCVEVIESAPMAQS